MGFLFRGDTPHNILNRDFGVSFCVDDTRADVNLDITCFPVCENRLNALAATNRDFGSSPISREQFNGTSNRDFAVLIRDKNTNRVCVIDPDCDDQQNTRVRLCSLCFGS